ncbi:MAG: isocitrate/isopropylmalate family dehydrogenase, partial [Pseudomonadota bacterium]
GKGIANPCASIASIAMLLRHSLGFEEEAEAVENALSASLNAGARTADIAEKTETALSTQAMTEAVLAELN